MPPDETASGHIQSMLHPAGPAAERIAELWWVLFVTLGVIFAVVMLLLWIALRKKRSEHAFLGNRFVLFSGVVFPTLVVVGFLLYSLTTSLALRLPPTRLTVEVIGHQWWWEVRYPDHDIITANMIHIPAGEPVRVRLRSADVIHSFWVPNLNGKMDMLPDHTTNFWIASDKTGVFRGQCAEYCGLQHALMAFSVKVMEPAEFELWLEKARTPAAEADTPGETRGKEVFFEAKCSSCHAIKGTEAAARIGPDLTHLADRLTLGAGTVPNTRGNLAGWVANPQALKPGVLMPPSYIPPEDFHALLDYLVSLK